MGLHDTARADWQRITSSTSGPGIAMLFEAPGPATDTANVMGIKTKHHLAVDEMGRPVNVKTVHVSVSEKLFTDLAYPVRNTKGEVSMKGHKVTAKDSTGTNKIYVVRECQPDETLGVLLFTLGTVET